MRAGNRVLTREDLADIQLAVAVPVLIRSPGGPVTLLYARVPCVGELLPTSGCVYCVTAVILYPIGTDGGPVAEVQVTVRSELPGEQ